MAEQATETFKTEHCEWVRYGEDAVAVIGGCGVVRGWRPTKNGNGLRYRNDYCEWMDDDVDNPTFDEECKQALRALVGPPPWEQVTQAEQVPSLNSPITLESINRLGDQLCALSNEAEHGFAELKAIAVRLMEERNTAISKVEHLQCVERCVDHAIRSAHNHLSEIWGEGGSIENRCEQVVAAYKRLRDELHRERTTLNEVVKANEQAKRERDEAIKERDAACKARDAAIKENEETRRLIVGGATSLEVASLRNQLEAARANIESIKEERDAAIEERDAARVLGGGLIAERNKWIDDFRAVTARANRLQGEVDSAKNDRDRLSCKNVDLDRERSEAFRRMDQAIAESSRLRALNDAQRESCRLALAEVDRANEVRKSAEEQNAKLIVENQELRSQIDKMNERLIFDRPLFSQRERLDRAERFLIEANDIAIAMEAGADRVPLYQAIANVLEAISAESEAASVLVCPWEEPMHFHHDGCPSCMEIEEWAGEIASEVEEYVGALRNYDSDASAEVNAIIFRHLSERAVWRNFKDSGVEAEGVAAAILEEIREDREPMKADDLDHLFTQIIIRHLTTWQANKNRWRRPECKSSDDSPTIEAIWNGDKDMEIEALVSSIIKENRSRVRLGERVDRLDERIQKLELVSLVNAAAKPSAFEQAKSIRDIVYEEFTRIVKGMEFRMTTMIPQPVQIVQGHSCSPDAADAIQSTPPHIHGVEVKP